MILLCVLWLEFHEAEGWDLIMRSRPEMIGPRFAFNRRCSDLFSLQFVAWSRNNRRLHIY